MPETEYNTIRSYWNGLISACFAEIDISKTQHDEMQKAFYAGAAAVISIMIDISSDNMSDEAGAELFESLRQEIIDFRNFLASTGVKTHETEQEGH